MVSGDKREPFNVDRPFTTDFQEGKAELMVNFNVGRLIRFSLCLETVDLSSFQV